jgi:hypothetical protein
MYLNQGFVKIVFGVNVMITAILTPFRQKWAIFLKNQCYDNLFCTNSCVSSQNRYFFGGKYFKIQNFVQEEFGFFFLHQHQGCQMVCFQTKSPNLGKNFRASDWKMLIFLWPFGIFYDQSGTFCVHLVHFSSFGIMLQEKSGNPDQHNNRSSYVIFMDDS